MKLETVELDANGNRRVSVESVWLAPELELIVTGVPTKQHDEDGKIVIEWFGVCVRKGDLTTLKAVRRKFGSRAEVLEAYAHAPAAMAQLENAPTVSADRFIDPKPRTQKCACKIPDWLRIKRGVA